ncbi:MAG: SAM-dependent methyltransferase [Candidatus Rifleibacteriota bacterium]
MSSIRHKASFRDPDGFIFVRNNEIYRQINKSGRNNFETFIESGLYEKLEQKNLIIRHEGTDQPLAEKENGWKVIKPEKLNFISYPYEWSFSQLKDAALATLAIQKTALNHGMILRDASAYNIQFKGNNPLLIDSLSFEPYSKGSPWIAYRQFCQHFLAPLALMSYTDLRLNQLLKSYIDGVPLDLAAKLLPFKACLKLSILLHVIMHARSQNYYAKTNLQEKQSQAQMSSNSLMGLIDSLESGIKSLTPADQSSEWQGYYSFTNYTDKANEGKIAIIREFIETIKPANLWDLGANNGFYSRLASKLQIPVVSFDIDENAIESNYLISKKENDQFIVPLLLDLANPAPAIGWRNIERQSFIQRGPADTVMALALIHHLAISNNVPLHELADFFRDICHNLIIEFIPKCDSQVKILLQSREDIFGNYNPENFEKVFCENFEIVSRKTIPDSERILYLMKKKAA